MKLQNHISSARSGAQIRIIALVLAALAILMLAYAGITYAAEEQGTEEPIRAIHKVKVGEKQYCFFVQQNAVIKPAELFKTVKKESETEPGTEETVSVPLTDEELTDLVLERAGFYMKEPNCTKEDHKAITPEDWKKDKGSFVLDANDITAIREAAPVDGAPVRLYMNINVVTETSDTSVYPKYYRIIGPELLFVVIASEEDAKITEDICKAEPEEKKEETVADTVDTAPAATPETPKKIKTPKIPETPKEELPEYKTIKMLNREGGPLEETLKDGDPVTLTWKDVGKRSDGNKTGFFSHIPGGVIGFILILAAIAALIAAAIMAMKKRREENK